MLSVIHWNVDPEIFNLFGFSVRWYGLSWAMAFLFGYQILSYMMEREKRPQEQADDLLLYVMVSAVVGARFGHYFFYETPLLFQDPLQFLWDMVRPPYAGLASHGAAVGIPLALYLYARKYNEKFLYLTDRIVIVTASGGAFIRFGNLLNSEIVGKPTDQPWGFVFERLNENFARHPAQLYECLSCVVLFVVLFSIWKKNTTQLPLGLLTGIFFIALFAMRFFYEFLKENQVSFEDSMSYNMGQWLSLPGVLFGVVVLWYALKYPKGRQA
jgi:phosphatidylglycerol---prolipoprotein diacylglyceryl transferase